MKSTQCGTGYAFERSYRDTVPIKNVTPQLLDNKTPLVRSKGLVGLTCGVCLLPFERPAAWAKRVKAHYCGRACAAEANRKPKVEKLCIVCANPFMVSAWKVDRQVTCSRECCKASRKETTFTNGLVAMAQEKEHKYSLYICEACGSEFKREPSWERRFKPRFCSRSCRFPAKIPGITGEYANA